MRYENNVLYKNPNLASTQTHCTLASSTSIKTFIPPCQNKLYFTEIFFMMDPRSCRDTLQIRCEAMLEVLEKKRLSPSQAKNFESRSYSVTWKL